MQKSAILTAAVLSLCTGTSAASSAVAFLCNAAHTGVCGATALSPKPKPLWRFFTDRLNRSTPAYANGVVYVGSNNGRLYALDANTGRPRWSFKAHEPVSSSPAIAGGAVYFADDRMVYALDRSSGKVLWSYRFGADVPHPGHQWDFLQSSPTIVRDRLYIGSGDGRLYAFDRTGGRMLWSYATSGRVRSTPAYSAGVVYAGSFDGAMYAVSAESGHLLWRFKTKGNADFPLGEIQSSPTLDGDFVFFGSRDGTLYALDRRSGKTRWTIDENGSWVISTAAVRRGIVYYGTSDNDTVRAVRERDGRPIWKFAAGGRVWSSPVLVGKAIFFGIGNGEVEWLDAATAKLLGYADSEGTIYSSVTVADGTVFYTSDDGYVYAVR
ncbi:MAG TPA: PQQ-binding-like beta-propeller repeat protein [Candidatus Baltobacteraceae bacterium]|jgi:outer membrane protein assembly factor BamB|nr:PQQ-binding-like beta-propeller repeat protein [Candidatus Baltobacteraceae bacterium]